MVSRLVQRLSTLCTQIRVSSGTTGQKIAERSTDALRETLNGRTTRPTKDATKTNHATSVGSSEIQRYLYFGHGYQ